MFPIDFLLNESTDHGHNVHLWCVPRLVYAAAFAGPGADECPPGPRTERKGAAVSKALLVDDLTIIYRGLSIMYRGLTIIYRGLTIIYRGLTIIFRGLTIIYRGLTIIYRGFSPST